MLLMLGAAPHILREIAGHSDIKVTMTAYAHCNLDEHAAALRLLSGTLLSATDVKPDSNANQDQADPS
ncbi:MAG: hypothetical protein GEV09_22945 [Pseudonocardiaceae bacterium]|nr:hypothetical protein [Pseudonocardiaceae bacterium]